MLPLPHIVSFIMTCIVNNFKLLCVHPLKSKYKIYLLLTLYYPYIFTRTLMRVLNKYRII